MSFIDQTVEFFANLIGYGDSPGSTISAVLGACLSGLTCGALGSFIILRRMSLFADMLGHAVLPGVAIGFILAGSKSTPALLLGSLVAGLLAAALTRTITSYSRIKDDASLGITLSLFYAIGIWLLSWITRRGGDLGAKASGLNQYLFGNSAIITTVDLIFLALAALVVLAVIGLFFKEISSSIFDPSFTDSIGLPRKFFENLLLVLLTLVIVVSLKILGVILVAALLVIPPATAYLLTDKLPRMVLLSAALGGLAGFGGVYLDFVLLLDEEGNERIIPAQELWNKIIENSWESAEPGLLNIGLANKMNNLHYSKPLIATNPCGEIWLEAYGCCCLGAVNLSRHIHDGKVEWESLADTVRVGVRFLDNVLDVNQYPVREIEINCQKVRRIGLGIMGLGHSLVKMGVKYGSPEGNAQVEK
jgi:manganese/zinc/iron transport system permease protein